MFPDVIRDGPSLYVAEPSVEPRPPPAAVGSNAGSPPSARNAPPGSVCHSGVPTLPPPSVRALLRHYAQVAREDAGFRARAQGTWLLGPDGRLPQPLGVADRTAHRLLAPLPAAVARRWRADWHAHGLLRPNGRETFTGCVLLPLIPVRAGDLALAALPLTALADPRTIAVRNSGPGWTDVSPESRAVGGPLYACSDPFDALILQAAGVAALAMMDGDAPWSAWHGLRGYLQRLRPRRLCLVCAATAAGERVAERWRDLATAAGVPVDTRTLPPGCTLRDVAHLTTPDAAVQALLGRRPAPRVDSVPSRPATDVGCVAWHADASALSADLSAYLVALRSGGRGRDDCRRTAAALALLWRCCAARGVKRTAAVQRRHLEAFQASLVNDGLAAAATTAGVRARTVAAVRGFLRWALATGRTHRDVAAALAALRRPTPVPPRVLGVREIERTLAAIPHRRPVGLRDRAMLELLYATGIRRGELAGLEVADVDGVAGTLRVRRGKGGTSRLVPLTRRAVAWVQRYLECARPRHLADPAEPALFLSRRGRRLTPKQVTGRMHACWAAVGLAHAGSCHVVRHSVATLMHDRGADIRDLQALLGHALLTSTQLYTRVSMQRLHEVHRRTHPGAGDDAGTLPPGEAP